MTVDKITLQVLANHTRALLPYCQALLKLAPQSLAMKDSCDVMISEKMPACFSARSVRPIRIASAGSSARRQPRIG